jgi:hypothetical protein
LFLGGTAITVYVNSRKRGRPVGSTNRPAANSQDIASAVHKNVPVTTAPQVSLNAEERSKLNIVTGSLQAKRVLPDIKKTAQPNTDSPLTLMMTPPSATFGHLGMNDKHFCLQQLQVSTVTPSSTSSLTKTQSSVSRSSAGSPVCAGLGPALLCENISDPSPRKPESFQNSVNAFGDKRSSSGGELLRSMLTTVPDLRDHRVHSYGKESVMANSKTPKRKISKCELGTQSPSLCSPKPWNFREIEIIASPGADLMTQEASEEWVSVMDDAVAQRSTDNSGMHHLNILSPVHFHEAKKVAVGDEGRVGLIDRVKKRMGDLIEPPGCEDYGESTPLQEIVTSRSDSEPRNDNVDVSNCVTPFSPAEDVLRGTLAWLKAANGTSDSQ